MAEVASAFVSLLPSARGFGSKLDREITPQVDAAGHKAGKVFGTGLKVAAGAALAGGVVLGKFLKDSIGEARESQKVGALTNQVIKSTGGVAKVTAKQVGALSTAISNKTGIDDEAIQSASNLLLTFTNVRNEVGKNNDVFNQATQAATDMGAALGKDPRSSAIQLGKALNDPVKGITALSRVGVSFTAGQKKQIATMVKAGDTLGAQKIILGELQTEFGGAAAASSTAGDKFRTAFKNLEESVGTALLPLLDKVLGGLTKLAIGLTGKIGPAVKSVGVLISGLAAKFKGMFATGTGGAALLKTVTGIAAAIGASFLPVLSKVVGGIRAMFTAFGGGGATIDALKKAFGTIKGALTAAFSGGGGGVAAAIASFKSFATTIGSNILPVVKTLGGVFRNVILPAFTAVAAALITNFVPVLKAAAVTFRTVVLPAVIALGKYLLSKLVPVFKGVVAVVLQVIPVIAGLAKIFYSTVYPAVVKIAVAVATKLKPVFDQLVATITGTVLPAVSSLAAQFVEWMPTIKQVVGVIVTIAGKVLTFAAVIVGKVLPAVIRLAGWLVTTKDVVIPLIAAFLLWKTYTLAVAAATKIMVVVSKAAAAAAKVWAAGQWLLNAALDANPIGIIIIAIAALVAGFVLAYEHSATFRAIIAKVGGAIADAAKHVVAFVKSLKDRFGAAVAFVKGVPARIAAALGSLAGKLAGKALEAFLFFFNAEKTGILAIVNFVKGLPGRVVGAIAGLAVKLGGKAREGFAAFLAKAKAGATLAVNFVKGIPGRIGGALGSFTRLLFNKGKDLITGLIDGIRSMAGTLVAFVGNFVKKHIPGPVAKVLGISSPSKVMAAQAKFIPLGMIAGIESQTGHVETAMTRLSSRIKLTAPALDPSVTGATTGATARGGHTGPMFQVDKVEAQDVNHFLRQMKARSRAVSGGGVAF